MVSLSQKEESLLGLQTILFSIVNILILDESISVRCDSHNNTVVVYNIEGTSTKLHRKVTFYK